MTLLRNGALLVSASIALLSRANAQTVAIVGGTVFPVSGPRIEHGTVLMRDGVIIAVGQTVPIPAGATTIDATGKWVTPGLVNASSALGVEEIGDVTETLDNRARAHDAVVATFSIVDGVNPASPMIPAAREDGVTSVALIPGGHLISGQAAFVDLVPGLMSDMILHAPAAIVAELGTSPGESDHARGEETAALRALFDDVHRFMAHRALYDEGRAPPYVTSYANLQALAPVVDGKEPLLVRADRAGDIEAAMELARGYHLLIEIVGGAEAWEIADTLAHAHIGVMTGTLSNDPRTFNVLGARQDNAALLRRAGVSVTLIGNADQEDATPFATRNIRQDAGTAVAFGMPWDDALQAITLAPAEVFGVSDRVGSLATGREANIVVWSGDPFEFTTKAEHVFVRGREMHDVSRQDLLTARYKTLPPQYEAGH